MKRICYITAMKFHELLTLVGAEPIFDTSLLFVGNVQRNEVQRQLARWVRNGNLQQVRRGLYSIAPPYRRVPPHPFLVANHMVKASYVSCQSALAWHGLIPEYTPVTVSVTTVRPGTWQTSLGDFIFRHVKVDLFFGYRLTEVATGQQAFVARPEKALLDLIYLTPRGDTFDFLEQLRLQNLERLDRQHLQFLAERSGSTKLKRAVSLLIPMAETQERDFETL
jgi:predicted transcriptional regulator of viral defense system